MAQAINDRPEVDNFKRNLLNHIEVNDPEAKRFIAELANDLYNKAYMKGSGRNEATASEVHINAPGYTPEECKELVSDQEVEAAFEHTNFGSMTDRAVIRHGLLKVAGGWYQGHTSNTILVELNLKKSMDENELTLKGRRYLYAAYDCFEKEGV